MDDRKKKSRNDAGNHFGGYLFVYFKGNSPKEEQLHYGVSKDGLHFRTLNHGNSVYAVRSGCGCIRDPFVLRGEDGYFYIIATDMKSSLGWRSNHAIVVLRTRNLIDMERETWIDYHTFEGTRNCDRAWAPQVIWCEEKQAYMIYLTLDNQDGRGTILYRHYAKDLCRLDTYTEPEIMFEGLAEDGAAIDGDIIRHPFRDGYVMFYSGKRLAEASLLSGEWKSVRTIYEDGMLPMKTQTGKSMGVEGSNIWKLEGENRWIIAADGTAFNGGCYALVETEDFVHYRQLGQEEYSFDFTPRHGYVIPLSEIEYNSLEKHFG